MRYCLWAPECVETPLALRSGVKNGSLKQAKGSLRWLHPISPKVRKFEGSRVRSRRFFSPKVRKLEKKGSGVRTKRFCSPKVRIPKS